jgi:hypothetical protein
MVIAPSLRSRAGTSPAAPRADACGIRRDRGPADEGAPSRHRRRSSATRWSPDRGDLRRGDEDREGFWARQAAELDWFEEWDTDPRLAAAVREVVRRRQAQRQPQLPRPARRGRPRRPGRLPLGGRAGRHPHHHLRRAARRGPAGRQRAQGARGRQGRPGRGLPADDPGAAVTMLACARIGAVHSVVFGGFSAQALRDRINDSDCKVLVTADGGYRRGSVARSSPQRRRGARGHPSIEHVLVVQRGENDVEMVDGRDVWWHELVAGPGRRLPARADGQRGPALPALHLGHDRASPRASCTPPAAT